MKPIYLLIFTLMTSACQQRENQQSGVVEHYGILREIMMELKLDANVNLTDLRTTENLYAVGALEGLSGEIMILNGKAYKTTLNYQQEKITDHRMNGGASLLVTAQVEGWTEHQIHKTLNSMSELETELKRLAEENNIDTTEPFPFMLTGSIEWLKSHVIYAPGASEKSHDAFKRSGIVEELTDEPCTILGFYSEKHQTVYTHHDSFIHAHVLSGDTPHTGHIDEITVSPTMTLKLPKTW